jgi:predicted transcriptional regulator
MSETVTFRLDDERLQAVLDEAEEEHGSRSEAMREALRRAYVEDDSTTTSVDGDGGLPKAAREGYAALREHANVGERLSLDAAESIIAQRVQLRKDTVRGSVVRKLHGAGWIAVEQGIHEVAIIVGDRAASDGGRNLDVGVLDDRGDDVDAAEVDSRLDELAEATAGGDER